MAERQPAPSASVAVGEIPMATIAATWLHTGNLGATAKTDSARRIHQFKV
jgi:hypothetical protein